jgi:hypothetical protein
MYATVYILYSGPSLANTTLHINLMQIHENVKMDMVVTFDDDVIIIVFDY